MRPCTQLEFTRTPVVQHPGYMTLSRGALKVVLSGFHCTSLLVDKSRFFFATFSVAGDRQCHVYGNGEYSCGVDNVIITSVYIWVRPSFHALRDTKSVGKNTKQCWYSRCPPGLYCNSGDGNRSVIVFAGCFLTETSCIWLVHCWNL